MKTIRKTSRTPAAAGRAWRARWRRVNAFERWELRRMTMGDKLRQIGALMASADLFGDDPKREREVVELRGRWNRLRKAFRG